MKKYFSSLISHLSSRKGFTLIELLVTISIIGVLSSFLLANFIGVRQRARDGVRKSDLRQIQSALELFRSDNGCYPALGCTALTVFPGCSSALASGGITYMQKIPCDPSSTTSNPISYTYVSPGTTYSIIACLENINDPQKDMASNLPSPNPCDQSTNFAYTLQNP